MKRVLVWGLSNNRAGTEAVIEAYVRAADPQKYSFDFLCYDDPVNYGCLFSGSSYNRVFKLPIKIAHPFRHRKALASFMDEHANEYEAVWFNANDISNIDILLAAEKKGIKHRICTATMVIFQSVSSPGFFQRSTARKQSESLRNGGLVRRLQVLLCLKERVLK